MRNYFDSIGGSKVWIAAAVVAALLLAVVCGCEDDTSTMAQQMGGARPGSSVNNKPQSTPPANTPPAQVATGAPGTETPAGDTGQDTGAEPGDAEYMGPVVITDKLDVKAPYPEFSGEGRYDITVNVHTEEPVDGGVWDILLFNKDGEEVGKQQQFLVIPSTIPKSLVFYAFYCKNEPDKIEFRLTDKEAVVAGSEEGAEGGSGGRGLAGAGGGGGASERTGGSGGMDRGAGSGGGDEGDEDF